MPSYQYSFRYRLLLLEIIRQNTYNMIIHILISEAGVAVMDYMSVKQAAAKWDRSERWVQKLCEGNRIEGVQRFGSAWMIPKDAGRPADARIKSGKYIKPKKGD